MQPVWPFNVGMKLKFLVAPVIAGTLLTASLFAQTAEMTGKIVALTPVSITVVKGRDQWVIQRKASTTVTGELKPGATVTVKYNTPDAQKKEGPTAEQEPGNEPLGAQKKE